MKHQSAYGLPLSGTDHEFMAFLERRKAGKTAKPSLLRTIGKLFRVVEERL